MDKQQYKPVPDVECLKYHGTPEKPDIKIFVSHRIDQESVVVDNPLYIPVRCGAVYDEREGVTMLGDDTGENISEKRLTFCELTVMYWAWKNVKADYYGLCHYRRFLSFANHRMGGAMQEQAFVDSMSRANLKECGLLDEEHMREIIGKYDMVVANEFKVGDVITVRGSGYKNNYDYFVKGWQHLFVEKEDVDLLIETIGKLFPDYADDTQEYFARELFLGFNCYIMRKELFDRLCDFEFTVLFNLEKNIKMPHAGQRRKRLWGYLAEILYSIWVYHERKNKKVKVKENQLIFFQDSEVSHALTKMENGCQAARYVPIVYPIDDLNHPELCASIRSIAENGSPANFYDIIVIVKNPLNDPWAVGEYRRRVLMLQKTIRDFSNMSIRFIDPGEELDALDVRDFFEPNIEHCYYRLMMPWILTEYKKCIILPCTSIVNCDIANLYAIEMGKNYAAGVKDVFFQGICNGYDNREIDNPMEYAKNGMGMDDPYNYINTDVLVLNLNVIRRSISQRHIIERIKKCKPFNPNEFLNVAFEHKVLFIDRKWNYIPCPISQMYWCTEYAPEKDAVEYRKSKAAYLINFAIYPFPWVVPDTEQGELFWEYARRTPVYETLLSHLSDGIFGAYGALYGAVVDLQVRMGLFDTRTPARKFADKLLPPGTQRREFAKKLLPKGSLRWRFCKQIYYIFKPQYRPKKVK